MGKIKKADAVFILIFFIFIGLFLIMDSTKRFGGRHYSCERGKDIIYF